MAVSPRQTRAAVSVTLGLVAISLAVLLFVTRDLSLRNSTVLFVVELVGLSITMPFLYIGTQRITKPEIRAKGPKMERASERWGAGPDVKLFNYLGLVLYVITVGTMLIIAQGMAVVR